MNRVRLERKMIHNILNRKIVLIVIFLCISMSIIGCSRNTNSIQIKGSDTMVNLAEAWVEEYLAENPMASVAVTGGGSGAGIAALLSKSTDITLSSREMQKKEIKMAEERGIEPLETKVAIDGIAVVVNPSNPVNKLTIKQLSDIFTGKIKNWKELGGKNENIVVLSRDRNSGTHVFFLEKIVKLGDKKNPDEFAPAVLMMPSSQAIVEEIMSNPTAIGYIGLGYLNSQQKAIAVAKDEKSPYVLPDIASVKSDKYPISRSLLFYTNGKPTGKIKPFFDFVLGKTGQKIVLKMDFVPFK